MDYLPKDATIEEACNWLQAKTGQTWVLPRLLECHLTPHFWLDYKPGYPAIFGNRIEGFQTRMIFQGDLCRLESDRNDALVNMFAAHDGSLIKVEPGLRVPLSELKFKREELESLGARYRGSPEIPDEPRSQTAQREAKPWETLFPLYQPRDGLHMLVRAAQEIANAEGFSDAGWLELEADMREAVRDRKKLPIRSRHTGDVKKPNPNDFLLLVTVEDVNKWLESRGSTYRWRRQSDDTYALDGLQAAPAQSAAEPAPVVLDSASNAPAIDPPPVATGNIAHAFNGLRRWDEKAWKDNLGSPPKWLDACIAIRGQRGIREHHWNPVLIGAALVRQGHAKPNNIRARFQKKAQLEDWEEAWKTYEADNFDTQ